MITYNLTINNMWTEQETKRYEEHLEKHWTRDGDAIKHPTGSYSFRIQRLKKEDAPSRPIVISQIRNA